MSTRAIRLEEIVAAAAAMSQDERAAYISAACGNDAELRAEAESLLAHVDADPVPEGGLEGALRIAGHYLSEPESVPERVGPCRVVRLLGRGATGAVYLAEQDEPRRMVAVKVLRSAGLGAREQRRFEREARALARLEHPCIARLYAAGSAELGGEARPYLVMEAVAGVPITAYCRRVESPVGLHRRLELIARVCDAADAAHHRSVVHRDLKPDHILIDGSGEPHVLDFGLARLLDPDEPQSSGHSLSVEGSLDYMSPEQAAGDFDHRSDVYSLGAVAYEVLSGRTPLGLARLPMVEAVTRIKEQEPARLGPIDRTLRGDVETIVHKALEKDRARRYQSAAELAADLRHFLNHEPIAARPATAWYTAGKFVQKHRALVLAVIAGLLATITALSVGLGLFAWKAREAKREAEAKAALATIADARAAEADALLNLIMRSMGLSDAPSGAGPLPVETLDRIEANVDVTIGQFRNRAWEVYAALARQWGQHRQLSNAARLAQKALDTGGDKFMPRRVRFFHLRELATWLNDIGNYARAEAPARGAVVLLDVLPNISPYDAAEARRVLSEALAMTGKPDEALAVADDALERFAPDLQTLTDLQLNTRLLMRRGQPFYSKGDIPGAIAAVDRALDAADEWLPPDDPNLAGALLFRAQLEAQAEGNKAPAEQSPDAPDYIEALLRECREIRLRHAAEGPYDLSFAELTLARHIMSRTDGGPVMAMRRTLEAALMMDGVMRDYYSRFSEPELSLTLALLARAGVERRTGRFAAAEETLFMALCNYTEGPSKPPARPLAGHFAKLYEAWGKPAQAKYWREIMDGKR